MSKNNTAETKNRNAAEYITRKLTSEEILRIYTDIAPLHFPSAELKPLFIIENLIKENSYLGMGLFYPGDTLIGYAFYITAPDRKTVLLDYYALLEEYRNLGQGSIFLLGMKENFLEVEGILLETENPDLAEDDAEKELRRRRINFYLRCGARDTGITCFMLNVGFRILFLPTGGDMKDALLAKELDQIYRYMLPEEIYEKGIQYDKFKAP